MKSKFFVDGKLIRKIEKDLKKRIRIEDSINKDLEKFYDQIDEETVLLTFKYIGEHGSKKQKKLFKEIRKRYDNSELLIEDTLCLVDCYEKMCHFNNDD